MHKLLKLHFYPTFQYFSPRVSQDIRIFKMASEQPCFSCENITKYTCISCATFVCNRSTCSAAEIDESAHGWVEGVSVGYCNDCVSDLSSVAGTIDFENNVEEATAKRKEKSKASGRRSIWTSAHIDDMVDIIVNNETYKKKLIFVNNRRSTNTEIYDHVLTLIKERHPSFPFNIA